LLTWHLLCLRVKKVWESRFSAITGFWRLFCTSSGKKQQILLKLPSLNWNKTGTSFVAANCPIKISFHHLGLWTNPITAMRDFSGNLGENRIKT
jgi:hypothetical protein